MQEKGSNSSKSSVSRRRKELEARAEVARRKLELAEINLELTQLAEEDSDVENPVGRDEDIREWVETAAASKFEEGPLEKSLREDLSPRKERLSRIPQTETKDLAEAIVKAIGSVHKTTAHPPAYLHELPVFDGTSSEWLIFKTVYNDTAPLFSNVQNMARLRKAVKGVARDSVKSILYSECQPEEVLEALRLRFGRPDAIILAELDKIKNLPKISENARDICVFASAVNNTVATVRGLKKSRYLYSPEILKSIVDKMPAVLKFRWYDFAASEEDMDLEWMAKFLNREADRCGPFAIQEEVSKKQQSHRQVVHATTSTSKQSEIRTCPHCEGEHYLSECKKFLEASIKDKWDIAVKARICFKCLQGRHQKIRCRRPPCKICKRWHHSLLHEYKSSDEGIPVEKEKEVTNNVMLPVNGDVSGAAYLKMVPVEVYGPRGSAIVLALLDEGSSVTLFEASLAEKLGLTGQFKPLVIETVGGKLIEEKDSKIVGMKIRGIHQAIKRSITGVRTIENLNLSSQKVDKSYIDECTHLSKIADQLCYDEERPKLLIGQDNWELIVSRSMRIGKKNEPVASLTYLGWVLHGCNGVSNAVEVYGPRGSAIVLALLDEGSSVTLFEASLAEKLGLTGQFKPLVIETVGGKLIEEKDSKIVGMKIRGIHQAIKRSITGVRTIENLNLSSQKVDKSYIDECTHLSKIADQLCYDEERPKLLIGQDNWELIVSRSMRIGKKNEPVASLTYLGWVLHGCNGVTTKRVNFVTCAHISTKDDSLEKLIKDHFALESLGILPRRPSMDAEGKALKILENTTRRLESGRFESGLLWKNENEIMSNNYCLALKRLQYIEKKLDKDLDLKLDYTKQIENLLKSEYAEEIQNESSSQRKWYLPHFAVTHPTKKKRRIVFDAAAQFEGKSLNDALLSGPDLLQSLFGVLLRFRQYSVAVVGDIKEMFLQIKIRPEDRDSLRFLWRGDQRAGQPKEYRMTSVIFGAACSPSTAIYVKNKNALEYEDKYPEAARAVIHNHYMDDYLQSFKTENEAVKIASEVDVIHKSAGFVLRGWASNSTAVLQRLTQDERGDKVVELGPKEEKTLGLRWFPEEDSIGFRTSLRNVEEDVIHQEKIPTKRQVTSAVMSTFDPMGLASPILIHGKRLLQNIWRSGVGWDDIITPEDTISWKIYLSSLQLLRNLRVPRCVTLSDTEGELHIFSDTSEDSYACAVYWRQKIEEKQYHVILLAGKARVTPLKPVSIPRLELQAALLGTRMACSVEKELDIKPKKRTYWTDSSTVLSWIKSDPITFKPYVAHRLAEIEDLSRPQEWRWVPTADNPADDATRPLSKDFSKEHRWFTGPDFLKKVEEKWPLSRSFRIKSTGEEKEKQVVSSMKLKENNDYTPDPTRFSQWTRLLRATARVIQFITLCRKKKQPVNVTKRLDSNDTTWKVNKKKSKAKKQDKVNMKILKLRIQERNFIPLEMIFLEKAENLLLKRCQTESFGKYVQLPENKSSDQVKKLKKLDVEEDNGLIKVHGRIDAAFNLEKSFQRPVVLDCKHHFTKLLISHYHEIFNHGNHATVINEIRQRYWIFGLRSAVRMIVHQCQWCRVYKGKPPILPTGDLPIERFQYSEPPFTCTGVDYFGPMTITVGHRHEKRWGALFTYMTFRAVHIELAESLSSDSMILALRRMAARRIMPKVIFSDNGTNFVKANKELQEAFKELNKEDIIFESQKLGVRWKFIPPGAPNMGGIWERLVRSIKTALSVTLKCRYPREEVLYTLLLEAEHIVNSRPLVEAVEDEEVALTPNHFLIGRSCGAPRIGVFTDDELKGRKTWKMTQQLADHFWRRWVREYLPILIPRKIKGKTSKRDLRCGDTVLIVDSALPRNAWPRGEIILTHPGPDGRTRIVEVRTIGGILKRPSSKVVLIVPAENREITTDLSPDEQLNNEVAKTGVGAAHEGEDVGDQL